MGLGCGPVPIWKASDQHVINDRLLIDIQYAHVGNNFTLTFQDPSSARHPAAFRHHERRLGPVVQRVDLRAADAEHRPDDELLPAGDARRRPRVQGRLPLADGARRIDQPYRRQRRGTLLELQRDVRAGSHATGCNCRISSATATRTTTCSTQRGCTSRTRYSVKRFTLNLGVRWDRQTDEALAATFRPTRSSRTSCRRLTSPVSMAAWCGTTFRRAWHDLRHHRQRQIGRARVLLAVLRADGAGPARRPDDLDRPGQRPLSVGGPQRRHVRAGERAQHHAVHHQERRVRSRPTRRATFRRARSIRTSRTTGRASSSSGCSRSSCATSRSRSTTCGASTISSSWTDRPELGLEPTSRRSRCTPSNCWPTASCPPITLLPRRRRRSRRRTSARTSRIGSATTTASSSR